MLDCLYRAPRFVAIILPLPHVEAIINLRLEYLWLCLAYRITWPCSVDHITDISQVFYASRLSVNHTVSYISNQFAWLISLLPIIVVHHYYRKYKLVRC